jgi:hypothetical protein
LRGRVGVLRFPHTTPAIKHGVGRTKVEGRAFDNRDLLPCVDVCNLASMTARGTERRMLLPMPWLKLSTWRRQLQGSWPGWFASLSRVQLWTTSSRKCCSVLLMKGAFCLTPARLGRQLLPDVRGCPYRTAAAKTAHPIASIVACLKSHRCCSLV